MGIKSVYSKRAAKSVAVSLNVSSIERGRLAPVTSQHRPKLTGSLCPFLNTVSAAERTTLSYGYFFSPPVPDCETSAMLWKRNNSHHFTASVESGYTLETQLSHKEKISAALGPLGSFTLFYCIVATLWLSCGCPDDFFVPYVLP